MLFVDGLVLILLFTMYLFFFASTDLWKKNGVVFQLSAFSYGEKVLVSLQVRLPEKVPREKPEAMILIDSEKVGSTVLDLEETGKSEIIWRTSFSKGKAEKVRAEIKFGGKTGKITAKIRKE